MIPDETPSLYFEYILFDNISIFLKKSDTAKIRTYEELAQTARVSRDTIPTFQSS